MLTPERQWHTSVMLDDFVNQVDAFVRTVFLTVTSKLSEFTEDTMRTAIKWGSYIEEVTIAALYCIYLARWYSIQVAHLL